MKSRSNPFLGGAALAAACLAVPIMPSAHAATVTWSGASGADWDTGSNWSGSAKPATADTALFNLTGITSVTNATADQTITGINFDTNIASTGAFTLGTTGGNKLTLQHGGTIQILSSLTGTGKTITVNAPLVLAGSSYNFTNANTDASNTLNFGGAITSTSGTTVLTLNGANTGDNTVSGNITNGGAGTMGVTKSGSGTWILSGTANTYGGTTTVSAGTLNLSGNLTTAGQIKVNGASNPVLNITGNLTQTVGGVRNFQLAASAGNSATVNVSGSGVLTLGNGMMLGENNGGNGTMNVSGGTVTTNGEIWFSGATSILNVSGGNFNATGTTRLGGGGGTTTSTLTVSGSGTYIAAGIDFGIGGVGATSTLNIGDGSVGGNLSLTGMTKSGGASNTINFNGGTLTANGNVNVPASTATVVKSGGAFINVAGANTMTIGTGLTDGTGGGGLTKSGSGTLSLSGANTYTGATTLNQGTITFGTGTLAATNGALSVNNNNTGAGTAAILNLSTAADTTTGSLSGSISTPTSGTNTATINTQSARTLTVNQTAGGTYAGVIAGAGNFTLGSLSTNTLTLTGTNTYTGTTTINAGTLQIGTGTTGSIDNTSSIVNNGSLVFNNNANYIIKPVTGTGNLSATAPTGYIRLGGNITQGGAVTIAASNNQGGQNGIRQSGATTITAPSITITGSFGSAGNDSNYLLTLDTSAVNGAITLDVYNGLVGHTYNGVSSVTANAGTGNVNISGAQAAKGASWAASLTGAINISSSYTPGVLTLNATANSSITGNLSLSSSSANTWTVNPGVTMTASGNLAGTGAAITKNGTGTLTFTGTNTYSGTTTINAGKLLFSRGGSATHDYAGTGAYSIASGATLEINGTAGARFNPSNNQITGAGTFIKSGSGRTFLTAGTNTLSFNMSAGGLIDVQGGTLDTSAQATNLASLNIATGAQLLIAHTDAITTLRFDALTGGGTLNMTGPANRTVVIGANGGGGTFSGVIGNSGTISLTKTGAGTQILSGTNTYTGATLISAGTLKLDATGTINNTSEVSLGTVGTFDVSAKALGYTVGTLKGSGNVTGALTVSTQLAIGNSPGTTHFSSNLTLGALSTYVYELTSGANPGLNSADLGDIAANLTITAGSILDLVQLGAYTVGNKFTLFAYDGAFSGTFRDASLNNLADGATFTDAGGIWMIDYNDTSAGANGGVSASNTYVTITAIPEPNAAALLGGLGTLLLLRRRR